MAAPQTHGILAICFLLASVAFLSSRYHTSAAFERPIHFSFLTLLDSGGILVVWTRWGARHETATAKDAAFLLNPSSTAGGASSLWQIPSLGSLRRISIQNSTLLVLVGCIIARTILFWRTIRTIHCSWVGFEAFLPVLIAVYANAVPWTIQLPHTAEAPNLRKQYWNLEHLQYIALAVFWACATRATVALSEQGTGSICPPGFFRWERQIPLAQLLTVLFDTILITHVARLRQESENSHRAYRTISRLLLSSACLVLILASFSFYNLKNIRWAFELHYVGVHDLFLHSLVASVALLSAIYVLAHLHPSTVALLATSVAIYIHHMIRMFASVGIPFDNSGMQIVAGLVAIVGVGCLLGYEKDLNGVARLPVADIRITRFLVACYTVLVGLLCGTYIVFYRGSAMREALSFPNLLSLAEAHSEAWILQAKSSANLSEAVDEYRRRHGVPPPPNFDKWFEYATEHDSAVIDDFSQIHSDLMPFWGIQPRVLRDYTTYMLENPWLSMGGLKIRGGKVKISEHTPGSHAWMMQAMQDMIEPFANHLPDIDLVFNLDDECRVAIPFETLELMQLAGQQSRSNLDRMRSVHSFDLQRPSVWPEVDQVRTQKMQSPYFSNRIRSQIYYDYVAPACAPSSPARTSRWWSRRDACRSCVIPHAVHILEATSPVVVNWTAATDLCHQPDLAYLHGFLLSPAAAVLTTKPFPVFSQSRTSGFADILIPSPWNFVDKVAYEKEHDVTWHEKLNTLFWRGSASDGYAARGSWQSFLRTRFVKTAEMREYENQLQGSGNSRSQTVGVDVDFVGEFQKCHQYDCQSEKDTFDGIESEPAEDQAPVPFQHHWQYRHLIDLDGAGFSGRFIPFLRSKSLVYRAGLFRTWFGERVHAWHHYVPIDVRLHELWGLASFFGSDGEGGRAAEKIAMDGRTWAERALRKEDMQVYMFRLLLEWGRLVDDQRETLGFAL